MDSHTWSRISDPGNKFLGDSPSGLLAIFSLNMSVVMFLSMFNKDRMMMMLAIKTVVLLCNYLMYLKTNSCTNTVVSLPHPYTLAFLGM